MCPVYHPGKDLIRAHEKLRLTTFRLKGFVWNERTMQEAVTGFSFLSDISEATASLYVKERIAPSTQVRVAFESIDATPYRAVTTWCHRYTFEKNLMSSDGSSFRLGVKFLFGSEAERRRFKDYVAELRNRVLMIKPGLKF